MKALVVNCSTTDVYGRPRSFFNLGAAKCADYLRGQGYAVTTFAGDPGMFSVGFDLVALSVIFSWHAPIAREIALRVKGHAEVWCGGPGIWALAHWWQQETGLVATVGVDARFESFGPYQYTFASRGCPVGCWFCGVPTFEGKVFTLYPDFHPAPVLCDNNISALPDDFQDHILARYAERGVKLKDCNSGWEPRTFTEVTLSRWRGKFQGPWRFAYDDMLGVKGEAETTAVRAMMELLHDEAPRRKQVYVLCGNEPMAVCYERALRVIEWGGEPHCQFVLPLGWLGNPDDLRLRADWTYRLGRDFCRYFNTHGWRSYDIADYKPRVNEPPPFRQLVRAA